MGRNLSGGRLGRHGEAGEGTPLSFSVSVSCSHRLLLSCPLTLQKLLNRPPISVFTSPLTTPTEIELPGSAWSGPVGSEAAEGGRRQQLFC